jgi:hypothetical protein
MAKGAQHASGRDMRPPHRVAANNHIKNSATKTRIDRLQFHWDSRLRNA